jgi:hypothetical protein
MQAITAPLVVLVLLQLIDLIATFILASSRR